MTKKIVSPRKRKISGSRFASIHDPKPEPFTGTPEELAGSSHIIAKCTSASINKAKKNLSAYSWATYPKGTEARSNDKVDRVTALPFDFDGLTSSDQRFVRRRIRRYCYIYMTTMRHKLEGSDDNHFRITIMIDRNVSGEEYSKIWRWANKRLFRGLADQAASDPSRIWYVAACPSFLKKEARIVYHRGKLLSPDEILAFASTKTKGHQGEPGPAKGTPEAFTAAVKAWNQAHPGKWPKNDGTCPACGHDDCFGEMPDDPERWACFSARHGPDSGDCGIKGKKCWHGDALDLEARKRGQSRRDVLTADGFLGPVPVEKAPVFATGSEVELSRELLAKLRVGTPAQIAAFEDELYRYDARHGVWDVVAEASLRRMIQEFDSRLVAKVGGGTRPITINHSFRDGVINCAKVEAAQPRFFDEPQAGFAFSNGFVHVTKKGLELVPHDPQHRARTAFPFPYDPDSRAPRFTAFLKEVFEPDEPDDARAKRKLLREFTGSCMLQIATSMGMCLVLVGNGSNGKSVFVEIILDLFPKGSSSATPPQVWGTEYNRATLAGKLINVVNDIPGKDILVTDYFKTIITGDPVEGRHPYGRPFTFKPVAGHIFSANTLPGTVDQTHGFWRRIKLVEFNRIFGEDAESKDELMAELRSELPGIAVWALKGAFRVMKRKRYTDPPSSAKALQDWRDEADQVGAFLAAWTIAGGRTAASRLYAAFREWAKETGHAGMSMTAFCKRLKAIGLKQIRGKDSRFYPVTLKKT